MILWNPACLVLAASPVRVVALVIVVSPPMAVLTHVEGFAVDSVMAAAVTLGAGVFGEAEVIGPGVIEVVAATLDFISCHELSWGVIKYNLQGEPVIGVCLCERDCTVVAVLLEFEQVPADLGGMAGYAADFCVESVVVDDLCL